MDISPDKQNIDSVFSNTNYYIDFYQRDYRWTAEPVLRLLDDVFHKFREQYSRSVELDPSKEVISAKYPWYYLNTYVTNIVNGRVYVVDGQQRLTTLSLILIKLKHLATKFESKLSGWIDSKIAGQAGFEKEFWMNHIGHRNAQLALFEGQEIKPSDKLSGLTAVNMVQNYDTISAFFDKELTSKHIFETFVFYLLHRLVLINLAVEQTDVSMVFEVINDRGVRLRPYEILKGKLLGQIDKIELEKGRFNELWEKQAGAINAFREDDLDNFFRFYLKARYASTPKEGQRFDGDYHRAMFASDMDDKLGLLHSPAKVKEFLKGEFTYYSNLYVKLRKAYAAEDASFRSVFFCSLLDIDAPFFLTLSACRLHDPNENEKIKIVSSEIDRLISLLQLQNSYDSNDFSDCLYEISLSIRDKATSAYRAVFDTQLTRMIAARRNVPEAEPIAYSTFRQTGMNLNKRFKRYFFARIDDFLATNMNLNPKHPLQDLVTKTGTVTGFHVEHILAINKENLASFGGDEELFEQERNRLGAILLLKGKDNISSNKEKYSEKLRSYANTLYWNESLRQDSYKSKLDMNELKKKYSLNLKAYDSFGKAEIEERHKLLFEIVKIIWA